MQLNFINTDWYHFPIQTAENMTRKLPQSLILHVFDEYIGRHQSTRRAGIEVGGGRGGAARAARRNSLPAHCADGATFRRHLGVQCAI
jgi:hypothetical protein